MSKLTKNWYEVQSKLNTLPDALFADILTDAGNEMAKKLEGLEREKNDLETYLKCLAANINNMLKPIK